MALPQRPLDEHHLPDRTITEVPAAATTTEAAVVREPFGASQILAMAVGVFFVVIGALGLIRSGLSDLTSPTVEVAGMGMTPFMSIAHLGVGVIALAGATGRTVSRGFTMLFGPLLIAAGVVALVQAVDELGWTETNGIAYLVAGGAAITSAILTPASTVANRRTTTTM